MNKSAFKKIIDEYLLPMLSGAEIESTQPSKYGQQTVAYVGNQLRLGLKPSRTSEYRVVIHRGQDFAPGEKSVAETFIRELSRIADVHDKDYFSTLVAALPQRVAAHCGGLRTRDALLRCIERFSEWSAQMYEGRPITAAAGIKTRLTTGNEEFASEIWKHDFGTVLTNGHDTMIVVSNHGKAIEYVALDSQAASSYTPFRFGGLAKWAEGDQVCVALNRAGEILVFGRKQLLFARRRGVWSFFPHRAILKRMHWPWKRDVRKAVYASCLDASFARTGACIGIASTGSESLVKQFVNKHDLLANRSSVKSRALSKLIGDRKFHELDRRLRQELLAVDGATVIDNSGKILAIGAIVKIGAGSVGGGRLAAARTLSRLGLGIKVSQDGGVFGYRGGPHTKPTEAFRFSGSKK